MAADFWSAPQGGPASRRRVWSVSRRASGGWPIGGRGLFLHVPGAHPYHAEPAPLRRGRDRASEVVAIRSVYEGVRRQRRFERRARPSLIEDADSHDPSSLFRAASGARARESRAPGARRPPGTTRASAPLPRPGGSRRRDTAASTRNPPAPKARRAHGREGAASRGSRRDREPREPTSRSAARTRAPRRSSFRRGTSFQMSMTHFQAPAASLRQTVTAFPSTVTGFPSGPVKDTRFVPTP